MTAARPAEAAQVAPRGIATLVAWGVATLALLASHANVLAELLRNLRNDSNHSVGLLVPPLAAWLVWRRRAELKKLPPAPSWLIGLAVILVGQAVRFFGYLALYESLERIGCFVTLAGVSLLVLGWRLVWRVRWIFLFLFLTIPLPGRVHNLLAGPLQSWATSGVVFLLELGGVSVSRDGNVVLLNERVELGVAEACSGLRMLAAFIVVCCVLAFLADRPRWQRFVVVLSSVPIAIVCNIARVLITAILVLLAQEKVAQSFFHDFAGLIMMPLAIALVLLELHVLKRLTDPESPSAPSPAGSPTGGRKAANRA